MQGKGLLKGKRVLIADDEPDVLDVLEELLSMCRVFRASTFEEAKRLLESTELDIAVLDIMGIDGYSLLEIARQRNVIAVMLTAHAFTPENLVRSIKEGAASYIPKEEIGRIGEFLEDVLGAVQKGGDPWAPWQEKLPSSYFERRWGAAWQDMDKEFWETFKAGIRSKKDQNR